MDKSISYPELFDDGSFYRDVYLNSAIAQVIVDSDLNIISANNGLCRDLQVAPSDVTGLTFCRVLQCSHYKASHKCIEGIYCDKCAFLKTVRDILSTPSVAASSVIQHPTRRRKRGANRWFYLTGSQIMADCDKPVAALAFVEITDIKRQEIALRNKLTLDLATGVMNKLSFVNSLQKTLEVCPDCGPFTLSMIDFDNFKDINDNFGHLMGDKVLTVFSDIAKKHVRKNDLIGRYGGEEFVFAFFGADRKQAFFILNRIHQELKKHFIDVIHVPVTFSAGIMCVNPLEYGPHRYSDLIDQVDKMLYQAKERGRSRAVSDNEEHVFNAHLGESEQR